MEISRIFQTVRNEFNVIAESIWQGHTVRMIKGKGPLLISCMGALLAIILLSRRFFTSSSDSTSTPKPEEKTTPGLASEPLTGDIQLVPDMSGYLGDDNYYNFRSTIQSADGTPLQVSPDDFYCSVQVKMSGKKNCEHKELPSSLFSQCRSKGGDEILFIQDSQLYRLKLISLPSKQASVQKHHELYGGNKKHSISQGSPQEVSGGGGGAERGALSSKGREMRKLHRWKEQHPSKEELEISFDQGLSSIERALKFSKGGYEYDEDIPPSYFKWCEGNPSIYLSPDRKKIQLETKGTVPFDNVSELKDLPSMSLIDDKVQNRVAMEDGQEYQILELEIGGPLSCLDIILDRSRLYIHIVRAKDSFLAPHVVAWTKKCFLELKEFFYETKIVTTKKIDEKNVWAERKSGILSIYLPFV